jgi:peptidoglycan/xylan/chitin deacetylase (PgdA/CDA1 family)
MKNTILLSFDVEEFDMPLEYGRQLSISEQMAVGMSGLHAISTILSDKNIRTTLFTTAHFAEYFPEQISELSEKHEIASHTYYHSKFETKDLRDSRSKLEEITGKTITGLRMPRMMPVSVDAVSDAGYLYDASIHPTWLPGRYNNLHLPKTSYFDNELLRIPASVSPTLRIPLFWLSFKNFPFEYYKKLAIKTLRNDGVLSLYLHPWEFVDISGYGLPRYTRNICGDELVERLQKLLKFLRGEGEFLTMQEYASSILEKSAGSLRSINIPSAVEQ